MGKLVSIGIIIQQVHMDFSQVKAICSTAEELGFDSITIMDHFRPEMSFPPKNGNYLECWTTLGALARETKKIRIGPLVTCASYRTPALLAKIAASLDHISEGRLNFGIGAGWFREEFEEYGITFDSPRNRVRRLEEAIHIIKMMWMEEEASFTGRHYKIEHAVCNPKPIQKPHPPILVGGGGKKHTLRVAAAHADGWNHVGPLEAYAAKLEVLKKHCQQVGRDFDDLILSWAGRIVVSTNENKIAELMPSNTRSQEDFKDKGLVGSPDQCIEKMQQFIDLGVTDFQLLFPDTVPCNRGVSREASLKMIRDFADFILPQFKRERI